MKRLYDNRITEEIVINYLDTIVNQLTYANGILKTKSELHLNDLNHASFSIDSSYENSWFYKTEYTYSSEGHLVKDRQTPGRTIIGESEYTGIDYQWIDNNKYAQEYYIDRGVTATSVWRYRFTNLPLKHDIIHYNNSLRGIANRNLPSGYYYRNSGQGYTYYKHVGYSYVMDNDIVTTRYDTIYKADTISHIEKFNYTYQ